MRIIYYSHTCFADCDFPLIGELQRKGHDVRYYISIASFSKRSTLIDIKTLYPHTGIFPASQIYKEFLAYEGVLDLSKVYVVNQKYKQKYHPFNLLLMARLMLHFIRQQPDVIHLTKPPYLTQKLLYWVKKKLVLTVHDPFPHSGKISRQAENCRKEAFRQISRLVLLNNKQATQFREYYKIPSSHIFINKLGMYSSILSVEPVPAKVARPFVLFFGIIAEYKGVEYLLEAMRKVHDTFPDVRLVVVGSGKFPFDIEPYRQTDYIEIRNHYICAPELAGLLGACEFAVCPYIDATQSGVIQTAFSYGVPMIATDVGALGVAVDHEKTGLVVRPCDVNELADAMCRLLSHPEMLTQMRRAIEQEWKPKMEWSPIADKYVEIYNN